MMSTLRSLYADEVPDPRRTALHRWWMRHGLLVSISAFALAGLMMLVSTIEAVVSHPLWADILARAAIFGGLGAACAFIDVLAERVIMRMTQILALFMTDVPPAQPRPNVTELYRSPSGRSSRSDDDETK